MNIFDIFKCNDFQTWLKGIVHFKMKILSSFTHPQVVSNLYEFINFTQKKIFWRMSVTRQLMYPI